MSYQYKVRNFTQIIRQYKLNTSKLFYTFSYIYKKQFHSLKSTYKIKLFVLKICFFNKITNIKFICLFFKTVGVECTGTNEDRDEEAHHMAQNNEFLSGIINLNPLLVNQVHLRMPNYRYKRFAEADDVIKVFPSANSTTTAQVLNSHLDFRTLRDLEENKPFGDEGFSNVFETVRERFHPFVPKQNYSDLSLCSPWLSKEMPSSAKNCINSSVKGKIYISVAVTHSSEDDFVVVQETESRIGFMPPVFAAKSTVAFPPICEGEVWTVGWIQALSKGKRGVAFDNNFMLIFYVSLFITNL